MADSCHKCGSLTGYFGCFNCYGESFKCESCGKVTQNEVLGKDKEMHLLCSKCEYSEPLRTMRNAFLVEEDYAYVTKYGLRKKIFLVECTHEGEHVMQPCAYATKEIANVKLEYIQDAKEKGGKDVPKGSKITIREIVYYYRDDRDYNSD